MELSHPELSLAERRVAALVSAGHSNEAIAERLAVGAQAVEWHIAKLSQVLEVSSRGELAAALTRLRCARVAMRLSGP